MKRYVFFSSIHNIPPGCFFWADVWPLRGLGQNGTRLLLQGEKMLKKVRNLHYPPAQQAPLCMETDDRPWVVASIHYMYFAAGLFLTTGLVTVVVSLCTDPPREYNIVRTTFMTRHDQRVRKDEHEVRDKFYLFLRLFFRKCMEWSWIL